MDVSFGEYASGRLQVLADGKPVSVDYPHVSDCWVGDGGVWMPHGRDLSRGLGTSGLLVPTSMYLEDNGKTFRLWRLTARGRNAA